MQNSWGLRAAVPIACAAMVAACGGSDGSRGQQDRAPNSASAAPAATSGTGPAAYTMTGCLEEAAGKNQYVLRHVRLEPRQAQPHSDTTATTQGPPITEGASVRLTAENDALKNYLGQRVAVTGTIVDEGRSTRGAAGTTGADTPSGDKSQAASPEHHARKVAKEAGPIARTTIADGTAPEVRVQNVKPTGEACERSLRPQRSK
jgi:hypothetical protein